MKSNAATLSRAQLIYGLCLPLAALIGFFLADPLRFSSIAILGLIMCVLAWPLFVRWYQLGLIASWHSIFVLGFLPGNLPLWAVFACSGFFVAVFHRSLNREVRLIPPGGVPWALIGIGLVVLATAFARGGVGLAAFGSSSMGGRKYISMLLPIMAYFALVSRPIPRKWAQVYVALFCLSGLTALMSHALYMAGEKFYWLFSFVDSAPARDQAMMDWDVQGKALFRSTSTMIMTGAVINFLLFRFGLRQTFNVRRPWCLLLLLACLAIGVVGGFRSFLVSTGILLGVLFFLEGLHRTKHVAFVIFGGLLVFAVLASCSDKLPLSVQRSISFLPLPIDASIRQDAQTSLDWRLEMWSQVVPDIPNYLVLGKGYTVDPAALQFSQFNGQLGFGIQSEWAILAGEYHNGPLSVILPFGLWGVLAFGWLVVAGVLRLKWFCRNGDPTLMNINRVLLAMFVAKLIFFTFFFGAVYSDLAEFAVLLGLAECLNSAAKPEEAAMEPGSAELANMEEERI